MKKKIQVITTPSQPAYSIGPPSARQRNAFSMAFRWRDDGDPLLDVFWDITRIQKYKSARSYETRHENISSVARRPIQSWASGQSNQSLRCLHEERRRFFAELKSAVIYNFCKMIFGECNSLHACLFKI